MRIKPVCRTLHKWIGALSGLVVFIVCITGALYAFKDEIKDITQPWRFIEPEDVPALLPSRLLETANRVSANGQPYALTYGEARDAVTVDYFNGNGDSECIYLSPYSGELIRHVRKNRNEFDFFRFVMEGHRRLWLPVSVGKPLVGWSVVAFATTLVTGLILWLPGKWNKKNTKRLYRIRWKGNMKQLNFDWHCVSGGLFAGILLILSLTGLVWNMDGFSRLVYRLSGGKELKPYALPQSDTLCIKTFADFPIDELYLRLKREEPAAKEFYLVIPQEKTTVCRVSIVHKRKSYYRTDNRYFDRYTLKELSGQGPYAGKYNEVSFPDKLRRMNLEIHDGRIMGITGKIIVFLAALAGSALPVTGWIILWKKRKKRDRGFVSGTRQ